MKFSKMLTRKKNQHGMSMVELMVSLGISGFLVMMTFNVKDMIFNRVVKLEDKVEEFQDGAALKSIMNGELLRSTPSMNFLHSNPGSINRLSSFWSTAIFNTGAGADITLDSVGQCLSLITFDTGKIVDPDDNTIKGKKTMMMPPNYFYKPRANGTDPLVYDETKIKGVLTDNNLSAPGQLVKLNVNIPSGDSQAYADYGIIFQVQSDGTLKHYTTGYTSLPLISSCGSTSFSTVDNFLRCIPNSAGGVVNVYITPVDIMKYCLKDGKVAGKGFRLFKSINNREEFLFADKIKSIKLIRENMTDPVIELDVQFCNSTNTTGC